MFDLPLTPELIDEVMANEAQKSPPLTYLAFHPTSRRPQEEVDLQQVAEAQLERLWDDSELGRPRRALPSAPTG
jgi:hypothetical protein